MSELSDYQRLVEAPKVAALEARVNALEEALRPIKESFDYLIEAIGSDIDEFNEYSDVRLETPWGTSSIGFGDLRRAAETFNPGSSNR